MMKRYELLGPTMTKNNIALVDGTLVYLASEVDPLLKQAREALERTEHELERIEWARGADKFLHLADHLSCSSCGFMQKRGHAVGCGLASARKVAQAALDALKWTP